MWSLMGQTLGLVMLLGTCKGLTFTRDGNIARLESACTQANAPVIRPADHYPTTGATGIHVEQSIQIAWSMNVRQTLFAKPESGEITITCTTHQSATRKIRIQDSHQVQIATYTPSGAGRTSLIGYVTITPFEDWLVGDHTVDIPDTLLRASSPDGPDSPAPDAYTSYTFRTQASCDTLTTEALCTPSGDTRLDCMWTGSVCETEVIVVAGATQLSSSNQAAAAWHQTTGASSGIQFVADGVPANAPLLDCVNGEYTSRGMRNGKPVYSQDWSVPVEHGGSRIQWETSASRAISGFRSGDEGWVVVCGGGVRHKATAEVVHVTAVAEWTAVAQWSAGTVTFTQASCVAPSTTGYNFQGAGGDLTRGGFAPTGIVCASGYSGHVVVTNCLEAGGDYTVTGCSLNSANSANSRRRRKHKKNRKVWDKDETDETSQDKAFNPLCWWR